MKTQNEKEVELIQHIVLEDHAAFKELYFLYHPRLFRFINKFNCVEQADEIINDVMHVVWKKAHSYNGSCQVSTWVFGIAYNKVRQELRNKSLNFESLEEDSIHHQEYLTEWTTDLEKIEMNELVLKALETLPPDQAAVVELTYFQGFSYKEISQLMGCPENTVKSRMFHARNKLLTVLKTEFKTMPYLM